MIPYGSRYVLANVISVTTQTGLPGTTTVLDQPRITVDDLGHGWSLRKQRNGIDLDLIAFDITRRAGMWFVLADLNGFVDPFREVVGGEALIVPTKQSFDDVSALLDKNA